jgi:5-methylcytosine-specific restriction endonuclease McrA
VCTVQLRRKLLFEWCVKRGRGISAKVSDHITPLQGNRRLSIDTANYESVCKSCHDALIQMRKPPDIQTAYC